MKCRSPSWGAWIEIPKANQRNKRDNVAPPRGERGLKSEPELVIIRIKNVAPPRGERGLKFSFGAVLPPLALVAPPRGERGLKCIAVLGLC